MFPCEHALDFGGSNILEREEKLKICRERVEKCILTCWTPKQCMGLHDRMVSQDSDGNLLVKEPEVSNASVGSIICDAISDLGHSGVDSEGALRVWWPFLEVPYTFSLPQKAAWFQPGATSNWFPLVKDSSTIATFAVFSSRCWEYPTLHSRGIQGCRGKAQTQSRALQTALLTHLQSCPGATNLQKFSVGSRLQVENIGSLEIRALDSPTLAAFSTSLGSKLALSRPMVKELLDGYLSETSGRSIPVVIM